MLRFSSAPGLSAAPDLGLKPCSPTWPGACIPSFLSIITRQNSEGTLKSRRCATFAPPASRGVDPHLSGSVTLMFPGHRDFHVALWSWTQCHSEPDTEQ